MNLPNQFPMTFFWPDLLWLLLAWPMRAPGRYDLPAAPAGVADAKAAS